MKEYAKVLLNGHMVDQEACIMMMDDETREELHNAMSPCSEQQFLDAYVIAHKQSLMKCLISNNNIRFYHEDASNNNNRSG